MNSSNLTPVTIEVMAEDIANGIRSACTECPVALALNRALPKGAPWDVTGCNIGSNTLWEMIPTPVRVGIFISDFDAFGKGEPFSFVLEVPAGWVEGVGG